MKFNRSRFMQVKQYINMRKSIQVFKTVCIFREDLSVPFASFSVDRLYRSFGGCNVFTMNYSYGPACKGGQNFRRFFIFYRIFVSAGRLRFYDCMGSCRESGVIRNNMALHFKQEKNLTVFITQCFVVSLALCNNYIRVIKEFPELITAFSKYSSGRVRAVFNNSNQFIKSRNAGIVNCCVINYRESPYSKSNFFRANSFNQ